MAVRPHLTAVERAAADAKHEAAAFLAAGGAPLPVNPNLVLPFKPKEHVMRKFVFGAAIATVVLLVVGLTIRTPQPADASAPAQVTATSDVYAIEATLDVKALPRQDTLSEADE
jgi:hypothetical protein